jgi:hypothetical protein
MFDFLKGWGASVSVHTPPDYERNALPSKETVEKAASLEVVDEDGKRVTFGSLIEKKVIIVFIRMSHFGQVGVSLMIRPHT